MGDFQEVLGALLGPDAPNLPPSVIARLWGEWEADYARWQRRDLSARRYQICLCLDHCALRRTRGGLSSGGFWANFGDIGAETAVLHPQCADLEQKRK